MKVTKADFKIFATLVNFIPYDKIKFSNVNILKRHWNSCLS